MWIEIEGNVFIDASKFVVIRPEGVIATSSNIIGVMADGTKHVIKSITGDGTFERAVEETKSFAKYINGGADIIKIEEVISPKVYKAVKVKGVR